MAVTILLLKFLIFGAISVACFWFVQIRYGRIDDLDPDSWFYKLLARSEKRAKTSDNQSIGKSLIDPPTYLVFRDFSERLKASLETGRASIELHEEAMQSKEERRRQRDAIIAEDLYYEKAKAAFTQVGSFYAKKESRKAVTISKKGGGKYASKFTRYESLQEDDMAIDVETLASTREGQPLRIM